TGPFPLRNIATIINKNWQNLGAEYVFYIGRRVLPWLDCCVSEFRPAHRPHEPAATGDSDT
ncbi:MAG: hypothetical protein OWU33_16750, partial [Firmicutes bacterium]|nr:hypothetical protein [Bacillota bacterium]